MRVSTILIVQQFLVSKLFSKRWEKIIHFVDKIGKRSHGEAEEVHWKFEQQYDKYSTISNVLFMI